jgi:hypothetical protein
MTQLTTMGFLYMHVDSLEKAVQGSISMVESLGRKGLMEGN